MTDRTQALKDECGRQAETCNYTATSFIIWLRWLRWARTFCLVAPAVFGALATWKMLDQSSIVAAVFTLLATVIPLIYKASRLDEAIRDYETLSGEFTNIRDRFRQASELYSQLPIEDFLAHVTPLLTRLEKARARSLAPPQWTFEQARELIKTDRYKHDYDIAREDQQITTSTHGA